jgi:lipid A ethanolaminephosphotransferase
MLRSYSDPLCTPYLHREMNLNFFKRSSMPAILLVSAWLVAVDNGHYWQLVSGLPVQQAASGGWFLLSLVVFSVAVVNLVLTFVTFGRASRYVLAALLCVSAAAAYFMDHYGIMYDHEMIRNIFETDRAEAMELLGPGLALNLTLFGVVPSLLIWRLLPARQRLPRILLEKLVVVGLTLVVLGAAVAPFFKQYASLVRNHREIRYLLTPVNYLQSLYTYVAEVTSTPALAAPLGQDAAKGNHWAGVQRKVVAVLVIGETARADHFSLDGYARETNPRLARLDIVNFSNVSSCGTATRVSLPCMFSNLDRADYSHDEAKRRENLLDVLNHAGISTVWLDNNSGCKGVCNHSPTWTAAGLDIDGMCEDGECYDAVLLDQLDRAIAGAEKDVVIVLHQNGSHGPAYYRRYPEEFRRFTPDCRSDDFADCTREEIVNSYDNTIYYTDYFLTRIIDLLDKRSAEIDTALMYVSDHGESLGEYGLYLHGTPYFLAPEAQTRVPMMLWMSSAFRQDFRYDPACLQGQQAVNLSHDNLFHSMLGMLDIDTAERDPRLDLFANCSNLDPSAENVLGS